MKKILMILAGFVCIIALILSVLRIIYINRKYTTPIVVTYNQGEELAGKNLKLQVTKSSLLDKKEFESKYCEFDNTDVTKELYTHDMKVLVVNFKIDNTGQDISEFVFTDFTAQSGPWANGWSLEMFEKLNDYHNTSLEIAPGESKELILVFCMYDIQFKKSSWNTVKNRDFYLVINCYPVKQQILLST